MEYNHEKQYVEKKHSGFGITSFVFAILNWIGGIIAIVMSTIIYSSLEATYGVNVPDHVLENDPSSLFIGLFILAIIGGSFFSAIIGSVGFFQSSKKKLFPILGVLSNLGIMGLILLLMLIGSFV